MRIAIIDLGSNSIRMSIFEKGENSIPKVVLACRKAVGLSEGMTKDMCLKLQPQMRAVVALLEYKETAVKYGAEKIIAVATAAVRKAKNRNEFLELAKDASGVEIKVIDGQAEAALDSLSVQKMLSCKKGVICDIGGGSTELVGIGSADKSVSLPYGSRGICEMFLEKKETEKTMSEAAAFMENLLKKEQWLEGCAGGDIIGIGGSLRAVGKFDLRNGEEVPIDKHIIDIDKFRQLEALIKLKTPQERAALPGIGNERAKTIVGGLIIFDAVANILLPKRILVADVGVSEGVAIDFYEKCGIL